MSTQQEYRISFFIERAVDAANQVRQVGDAVQQTDTKIKSSRTGVDQMGQSLANFSQRITGVTAPINTFGQGVLTLQQRTQQLSAGINPLNNAMNQLSTTSQRVGPAFQTMGTQMQNVATQTQTLSQRMQGFNATMLTQAGSMVALVGSGTQLFNLYDSLGDSYENLHKAETRRAANLVSQQRLQGYINKAIQEGKTDTDQYRQYVDELEVAKRRLVDISLNIEIKEVSEKISSYSKEDEMTKLLMTIPGIGHYSAVLIVSEIGDINRFPDSNHLCSYAGLIPSTHSSGGITYHGAITKTGSKHLRWIMLECVYSHIRTDKNSNITLHYR